MSVPVDEGGSTIAALSSPGGPARRGVLRLSGPRSAALARAVLRGETPPFDPAAARSLHRGDFLDGRGAQPVRVLWMRGPRSYTREDVVEFHLPGAPPLLAAALERLLALGAEAARPGEFTRRAFQNGRLDLSRAEGVLSLIEAGSEAERRAATLLLEGGLERRTRALRDLLLELATLCEASLDFDEADTGHVPRAELLELGARATRALDEALGWELRRQAPAGLPRVVLAGAPSAGKSSLWNALTGGAALVSPRAGTTRDALEGLWELGHSACLLIDGPGIGAAGSQIQVAAESLFARVRAGADLVLWVIDAARAPDARQVRPEGAERARILVWNKVDLACTPPAVPAWFPASAAVVAVSANERTGLHALAHAVTGELGLGAPAAGQAAEGVDRLLSARHREALRRARAHLAESLDGLSAGVSLDLVAEALRGALAALEDLAGRSTPEDVLERIFARFCVGK